MNIIAIANISNGVKTIGFRLLAIDTKEVKDAPTKYVQGILVDNKATISNLKIQDNKIVGSNGSIERLPKVVNGQLVGKSPLIIVEQLEDKGYSVSDFKGKIVMLSDKQVINYGRQHGIANGKIVKKGDSEFISAITGSYKVVKKNNDKYTGSLISGMKALNKILLYDEHEPRLTISYKDGSYIVQSVEGTIDIGQVTRNVVYESAEYTHYIKYLTNLKEDNPKDMEKILDILEYENIKSAIDNTISMMKTIKRNQNLSIDDTTGIIMPTKQSKYTNFIYDETEIDYKGYKRINIQDYKEFRSLEEYKRVYMDYLKVMGVGISVKTDLCSKNIVLCRECSDKGVSYSVLMGNQFALLKYEKQHLEYIYYNHRDYDNVLVEGNIMKIKGLDGFYSYDMDKIHSLYGRSVHQSNMSLKSNVLGQDYTEIINSKGELYRLDNPANELIVPRQVKKILPRAIIIDSNDRIVFGENIEECSKICFMTEYRDINTGISNIEIRNKKVYRDVVEAIYEIEPILGHSGKTFNFNFDITPEYMVDNILFRKYTQDFVLVDGKQDYLTDVFTDRIIKYTISSKLNNLDIFNIKNKVEFEEYSCIIHRLDYLWHEYLRYTATKDYKNSMDRFIINLEERCNQHYINLE